MIGIGSVEFDNWTREKRDNEMVREEDQRLETETRRTASTTFISRQTNRSTLLKYYKSPSPPYLLVFS